MSRHPHAAIVVPSLMLLTTCVVDVPDLDDHDLVFMCEDDEHCSEGFLCAYEPNIRAGYCIASDAPPCSSDVDCDGSDDVCLAGVERCGLPVAEVVDRPEPSDDMCNVPNGANDCAAGRACVVADAQGNACLPSAVCAGQEVSSTCVADGGGPGVCNRIAGFDGGGAAVEHLVCVPCEVCSTGACAARVSTGSAWPDADNRIYCDIPSPGGPDCSPGADSDDDGAAGCEDRECLGNDECVGNAVACGSSTCGSGQWCVPRSSVSDQVCELACSAVNSPCTGVGGDGRCALVTDMDGTDRLVCVPCQTKCGDNTSNSCNATGSGADLMIDAITCVSSDPCGPGTSGCAAGLVCVRDGSGGHQCVATCSGSSPVCGDVHTACIQGIPACDTAGCDPQSGAPTNVCKPCPGSGCGAAGEQCETVVSGSDFAATVVDCVCANSDNGQGWKGLGRSTCGAGIAPESTNNDNPDIAIDFDGQPVVALRGRVNTDDKISLRRWSRSVGRWENLTPGGIGPPGTSDYPSLALDNKVAGTPILVAIDEGSGARVSIHSITTTGVQPMGTVAENGTGRTPSLALDPYAMRPVVAYTGNNAGSDNVVTRQQGATGSPPPWDDFPSAAAHILGSAKFPALAFGSSPTLQDGWLAWLDTGNLHIRAARATATGTSWDDVNSSKFGNGVSGQTTFQASDGTPPRIGVNDSNRPYVAWRDASLGVVVAHWDGSVWRAPVGTSDPDYDSFGAATDQPDLYVDGPNTVIAWRDTNPAFYQVKVARLATSPSSWTDLGTSVSNDFSNGNGKPSVAIGPRAGGGLQVCVAWRSEQQGGSIYVRCRPFP